MVTIGRQLSYPGGKAAFFSSLRVVDVDMEMSPADAAHQASAQLRAGVAEAGLVSRQSVYSEGFSAELVRVEKLHKEYATGRGRLALFEELTFSIAQGELVAIVGESGAGKSTLLHILGALDTATSGDIYFRSTLLRFSSPRQAADFRNREVGYVWQFHYLLPEFTAAENVAMPLLARGEGRRSALEKAQHWLDEVELSERAGHRSGELSGGEQQRVSLARALITEPKLLLADEPTGDLDGRSAGVVFSLLERLHESHGLTSILVTHNMTLARRCQRVLRLEKGRVREESCDEA